MASEISLEASIKIRHGKKWKSRYCVLHKPSPSADFALLEQYQNEKKRKTSKAKCAISLEGFFGTETGFSLDKENETLAIICRSNVVVLAFSSQEKLMQWDVWIRNAFGCGCQYRLVVKAAPRETTLVDNQNVRLHLRDCQFCLTSDTPPRIVAEFYTKDIRTYGPVENKFCFEAGSKTGLYAGCYVLLSSQVDLIARSFEFAAQNSLHHHLSKKLTLPLASNHHRSGVVERAGDSVVYRQHQRHSSQPSFFRPEPVEITQNNFANVADYVKMSGIRVLDVAGPTTNYTQMMRNNRDYGAAEATTNRNSSSANASAQSFNGRQPPLYSNIETLESECRSLQNSFTSSSATTNTSSSRNSPIESISEEPVVSPSNGAPALPPTLPPLDLDDVPFTTNAHAHSSVSSESNSECASRTLPLKRSVRSQRLLRDVMTRPLSGSYSCYDGEPESPLVMLPPPIADFQSSATTASSPPSIDNKPPPSSFSSTCSKVTTTTTRSKCHNAERDNPCFENASFSPAQIAPVIPPRQSQQQKYGGAPVANISNGQNGAFSSTPGNRGAHRRPLPASAPPTRKTDNIFTFPNLKAAACGIETSQLNYCELDMSNESFREGSNEPLLPCSARLPKTAVVFPFAHNSLSAAGAKSGIEYAKIDEVATIAVMKNKTARAVERRERWSSIQTLSDDNGKEPKQQPRRAFLLRNNLLLRRRTSLTSLAGSTG